MSARELLITVDPAKLADSNATLAWAHRGWTESGQARAGLISGKRLQATTYPDQAQHLASAEAGFRTLGYRATVVIDVGGVGEALADLAERHGLDVVRVLWTGGERTVYDHRLRRYSVPKIFGLSALNALAESGRLILPAEDRLDVAGILLSEAQTLKTSLTRTGKVAAEASSGHQDDVLMSAALLAAVIDQLWTPARIGWLQAVSQPVSIAAEPGEDRPGLPSFTPEARDWEAAHAAGRRTR